MKKILPSALRSIRTNRKHPLKYVALITLLGGCVAMVEAQPAAYVNCQNIGYCEAHVHWTLGGSSGDFRVNGYTNTTNTIEANYPGYNAITIFTVRSSVSGAIIGTAWPSALDPVAGQTYDVTVYVGPGDGCGGSAGPVSGPPDDSGDPGGAGPPCPGCCDDPANGSPTGDGGPGSTGSAPDGSPEPGDGLPNWPALPGLGGTDVGGTPLQSSSDPTPNFMGMPVWRVSEPYISLWLYDEPLGYQPSIGSRISLKLGYKQREENAGMNPNVFSLGPKWNFSWLSSVNATGLVGTNYGSNTVFFPTGGSRTINGTNDYLSNARITGNTSSGFTISYPNGSVDTYGCIVEKTAYLTQHLNPKSQATTYNYSTNSAGVVQLSTVVDGNGGTNTLYYNSSNVYSTNLISKVTDCYGRSVNFYYSTNGLLTNIVDVGGISSSFLYNSAMWLTNLQTPYGTTTFALTDNASSNAAPNGRSVLVTEPDGSSELFLGKDSAPGVPSSYTNVPITSPFTNSFDNTNLEVRNTFHWSKMQYTHLSTTNIASLTTNDFAKATMKHWLLTWDGRVGPTMSLQRDPSPDAAGTVQGELVWYDHQGKTNDEYEGSQFLPLVRAEILPDGTTAFAYTPRNSFGWVGTNVATYGVGTPSLRTNIFTYSTNAIDVLTVTNALNVQAMSNTFNSYHEILKSYDALNETTTLTYDTNQRVTSITTPTSLLITNTYGTNGYLSQQIYTGFLTNSYLYTNGLIYSRTDPRNMTYTNTWDNLQRLTSRTYPDGTYASNQYTYLDRTATRDRLGNWTHYGYDSLRRIIAATNALGHYDLFTYCLCGALESDQDALGYVTAYSYDNQSRMTNVTYPDGYLVDYSYDLLGRLTNATDGSGVSKTNWFNNEGLVIAVSNSAGQIFAKTHDILDRVTNSVDQNGVAISLSYDSLNRPLTRGYPDGGTENFTYSAFGLVAYTNQLTNVTSYAHDAMLRKTAETNALAYVTQYAYSPASDLISLTDQNNHTTQWGYDLFGRVTNKIDANSTTILTYQYDADNRLTNRWSLAKSNTAYAYDSVGNLTNVTYPVSHGLTFSYDNKNELTSMSDAVGTTTFTYTQAGQLASEEGPWSTDELNYIYTDRLRTALSLQQPEAAPWSQSYTYDLALRMTSLVSPAGTFSYSYNGGVSGVDTASALVSKLSLPNGAWVSNTFDSNGRILGTWMTNGTVNLDSAVYTYNVGNQRLTVTRNGESTASYSYDAIGEVVSDLASEVIGGTTRFNEQLRYVFDAAGNLTYRTNNAQIQKFAVNSVNELTSNTNGGTLTVVGTATSQNSTTVTVNSTNALVYGDATFAATNMPLTTAYTAIGSDSYGRHSTNTVNVSLTTNNTAYAYDGNGNLLYDGLRTFAYDDENQLVQVLVTNAWLSQFSYDGKMRRRIRKEFTWQGGAWVQTNAVYYVYDGNVVIQERAANNTPTTTYTRGLDLSSTLQAVGGIGGLLAMTLNTALGSLNSNSYYYHSDANGNVTAMLNGSQYIVAKYLYDAFGNTLSAAGIMAAQNLYRISSRETHSNSGLVYYLFRYYDPNLQRWINRDPIGELGGINLYQFVLDKPVNSFDPYGTSDGGGDNSTGGSGGFWSRVWSKTKNACCTAKAFVQENYNKAHNWWNQGHNWTMSGLGIYSGSSGINNIMNSARTEYQIGGMNTSQDPWSTVEYYSSYGQTSASNISAVASNAETVVTNGLNIVPYGTTVTDFLDKTGPYLPSCTNSNN